MGKGPGEPKLPSPHTTRTEDAATRPAHEQDQPRKVVIQDNSTAAGEQPELAAAHAKIAAAYAARDLDGIRAGVAKAAYTRQGPAGLMAAVGNATTENVPGMLTAALAVLAERDHFHREHLDPVARAAHSRGMTAGEINAAVRAIRGNSPVGGGPDER